MEVPQYDHEARKWPKDPRSMLMDRLRNFFLSAIHQQTALDASIHDKTPAGSLYKTDGGWLKIHLQPPASDKIFSVEGQQIPTKNFTPLWALIKLDRDQDDKELLVMLAGEIKVHVEDTGRGSLEFESKENYLGQMVPLAENGQQQFVYKPPSEEEQITSAKEWYNLLGYYDLRSIVTSTHGDNGDGDDNHEAVA